MENTKTAKFYEWMQPYYLRNEGVKLEHWMDLRNTDRQCAGLPKLKKKPLENKEVIDHLSDVYYELRLKGYIQMDFQEFLLEVECFTVYRRLRDDVYPRRLYRPDYTGCEFRGHSKYVKNADHKPKEKNGDSWRVHKGIDRDKRKHGCWYKSSKKFMTNNEERSFRRWTKAQIKSENYDALGDDWNQDAWLWD